MDERSSLMSTAVLAAVLLAGCGGEGEKGASRSSATSATSVPAASATTTSPPVEARGAPDGAAATEDASPVDAGAPRTGRYPGSPPEVVPTHGERVWAVYLAVGSPDAQWDMQELAETESYLRGRYGYTGSGIGSVGCDQGAAEALGFDPAHNRVAVYFDSAAHAQQFVAVYDRQDVGSAEVGTYCLD